MTQTKQREAWIDWMRVIACFMVMLVHSTEPFYLGGDGAQILTEGDAWWSSFFDSFVRMCVPLFLIASSYLQFPLHYSSGVFLRKRAVRILIPFAIWSLVYAFYWGQPVENLQGLLLNFNYAAGHLWFVYMLVGIYILMPMLSAWAEKVSKRELQVYLGIWFFTTLIPIFRDWIDTNPMALTIGATGLPRQALFPLWGEASWNTYGTFYYISGMLGYLLLGLYFRRFVKVSSWLSTLKVALPCWAVGFGITFGGFLRRVYEMDGGQFPALGGLEKAIRWETTWTYDTLGVALMTIAFVLLFRKISASGTFYKRIVLPVSKASYGMYLSHMVVLSVSSAMWRDALGVGTEGALGFHTTPVEILGTAVTSYAIVAVASILLQRLPVVGKYLIG